MSLTDELCALFRRNFPYVIREDAVVREILSNPENHLLQRYNSQGNLFAAAVVHRSTILMLCVDEGCRRQGVGSELLHEAEAWIRDCGYADVTIGVGADYLCPGIPVRELPFSEELFSVALNPRIPAHNADFFQKRGYVHSWGDCNCFDMRMPLTEDILSLQSVGEADRKLVYRWAVWEDRAAVMQCTDDAHPEFTKFYSCPELYDGSSSQRVLIALDGSCVCGALIVCRETEAKGLGSVGCTAVRHSYRGRKIASELVRLSAQALYESGLREGYLGYTYSGLDRLYGRAGYAVSCCYFMAKKQLTNDMAKRESRNI